MGKPKHKIDLMVESMDTTMEKFYAWQPTRNAICLHRRNY